MFFVEREGGLVDMTGTTFRRFLQEGAKGFAATMEDWILHLNTLFPEARLRGYLEIRGTDANRLDLALAHAALWAGLVYGGEDVAEAALELTGEWTHEERLGFHRDCARRALKATAPDGRSAAELARTVLELASRGLERSRPDERIFLRPAEELAAGGRSPADELLDAWEGRWRRSVTRMIGDLARVDHV
jgi:glutamate--cysteine ligase